MSNDLLFDFSDKARRYIAIGDDFHDVEYYSPLIPKFIKGIGYIHDGFVFIYRGKKSKFEGEELLPGIYSTGKRNYEFIYPEGRDEEIYSEDNVMEMNPDKMFEEVVKHKESFIDTDNIETRNQNSSIFLPTATDDDDFLKYGVKKALEDKGGINLRDYKDKVANQFDLNNLKSVIMNSTKMTPYKFNDWCNLVGLRWTLTIEDDGTDTKSKPLSRPITLESEDFQ